MAPLVSTLRTADGLDLAGVHNQRPGCRARVVIVHGYAEHLGRYAAVTAALGDAGYECHLLDLRGHGRSGGVRGYVARFEDYLDDVELFLRRVEEMAPAPSAVPRILLGHSLGGLVALSFVARRPQAFDALAVTSPFLHPAMEIPWFKASLAALASRLAPTLLTPSEIDSKGLSHDAAIVAAYDRDPLVFKTFNAHWFFEVQRAQEQIFERAAEIRLPALFLLGSADPIADPARGRALFERLGSSDKHLEIYQGFLHEVLNETERERVVRDLIAWLDRRTANPPPLPVSPPPRH
jgi:alpha-beta hydrolase superfamily lysophospholipase